MGSRVRRGWRSFVACAGQNHLSQPIYSRAPVPASRARTAAKEKAPTDRGFFGGPGPSYIFLAGIVSMDVTVIVFFSLSIVPLTVTSLAAIFSIMASSPESTNCDLSVGL